MPWFHFIIVWVHLLAAAFWVGGMLFLTLVAVPLLRTHPDPSGGERWFVSVARRFRIFVWGAVGMLLITGPILLTKHVSISESPFNWSPIILAKLFLVALLLATSIAHEFFIAPKVRGIKHKNSSSYSLHELLLVKISPWIARLTLALGLATFLLAVVLARS